MKYSISDSEFYALYGHLTESSITTENVVKKGEKFAEL
jgi:hypothetical protein